MILAVTLSKADSSVEEKLGKAFEKIKIKIENSSKGTGYFVEMFTKTQVFHQHFSESELNEFLKVHVGTTFKNCVKRTESEEITYLTSKKGKVTELHKKIEVNKGDRPQKLSILPSPQKKKNYLLPEGTPVPFLILLGIMNSEGKVISAKYDKFRQINRFLEFIDDVIPEVMSSKTDGEPVRIADFGCGKSYLTFAVHYFLTEVKKIPCQIEGLDLKEDVIKYCNDMAEKLNLKGLIFHTGNISDYSGKENPDIVITLHACDTATDFALKYAVERNAKAILSVPCCQHQINQQLGKTEGDFESLLKYGLIKERFSALLTDALRGEWLESQGYKVQMLEFIDIEHTPKNLLIRAVKGNSQFTIQNSQLPSVIKTLGINPEIFK